MEYITIILVSVIMTVSLISGGLLWAKRTDVPDRSRSYLSVFCLWVGVGCTLFLSYGYVKPQHGFSRTLLAPELVFGGLFATIMYLCYPIEVMRPRQFRGRWLLLFLPLLVVTSPMLFGMKCQELHSWYDLETHIGDFDVLLRIACLVLLAGISLILLFIPYNWRKSSADFNWIRRTTLMGLVMTLLFYCEAFTNMSIFFCLHLLWCTFVVGYLTYHEFSDRLLPPAGKDNENDLDDMETAPCVGDYGKEEDMMTDTRDYWPRFSQLMDNREEWSNPDTTIETVCRAIGTNRVYLMQSIREHTGMTFNDFLNRKRIYFMADELRRDPQQDHKNLYFEAGFRSRATAYRNFVKFIGISPTDFVAAL